MNTRTVDVVVVGAGIIGCSIAHALAGAGRAVLVLDRGGGAGQGSTAASSAIIRFNYSTHAGVATAWESHYSWLEWEEFLGGRDEDGGLAGFVRTGSLCLDAPTYNAARVRELFDAIGVPYETWDAAQLRERLPQLDPGCHYPPKPVDSEDFWGDPDGEIGGCWTPDSGFISDPAYAAHNLATAAGRLGAEFGYHATVTAIETSGGRISGVVLADGTRISTPLVVNAAGPGSDRITAMAGVSEEFAIGQRAVRVEVHTVPPPPGYNDELPGPMVVDLDLGSYFRGTLGGELMVGGCEPACDPLEVLDQADSYRQTPTNEVYQAQLYRVARRLPDLTVPNTPRGIGAVYDVADDWIPIYDRTSLPGFYVAVATSGNQFKNAPLVGRYLRAIIEAVESGVDHDATPVRVRLPRCGAEVDLSAYSRLREITSASSFTVMG